MIRTESKLIVENLNKFRQLSFHHYPIRKILKDSLVALFIIFVSILIAHYVGDYITPAEEWIKAQGIFGPIIFILAFWVGTIIFIPGNLFAIASGLLFGLLWGFIYTSIAEVSGAILLFLIARYLARNTVEKYLRNHPKFLEIDKLVSKIGKKVMMLLRLVPLPYTFLCYLFGISEVSFKDYAIALSVIFPKLFLMVYYGYVASKLTKLSAGTASAYSDIHYMSLIFGVIVSIIAIAYMGHFVLLVLRRAEQQ
ncbi:MAG TPA: TVP38/TMEM64 family protein [Thermodesulfobacteriota bacterium]